MGKSSSESFFFLFAPLIRYKACPVLKPYLPILLAINH